VTEEFITVTYPDPLNTP